MQKAIRVTILVLVIGFLISLMVYNSLNPTKEDFTPWNEGMTLGDKDTAKYHYIMYAMRCVVLCLVDGHENACQSSPAGLSTPLLRDHLTEINLCFALFGFSGKEYRNLPAVRSGLMIADIV